MAIRLKKLFPWIYLIAGIFCVLTGWKYAKHAGYFDPPMVLFTQFENVQGLHTGGNVTIKGMKVGQIGKMELNMREGLVDVTLEFNQPLKIPKKSIALICRVDAIGMREIRILPPKEKPTPFPLKNGSFIKGAYEWYASPHKLVGPRSHEKIWERSGSGNWPTKAHPFRIAYAIWHGGDLFGERDYDWTYGCW
ncbi:MAG: MlaD family protein [Bacteroidota bacterium]